MYKIILMFCLVLAVAKGGYIEKGNTVHIDDYVYLNRLQYLETLQHYDTQLEYLKKQYLARLEGIKVQLDMVTDSIVDIEERLNPLELLSDLSKQCVNKYRIKIPTVTYTKAAITDCIVEASRQETSLVSYALNTRDTLESYYITHFDTEIKNCTETIYKTGHYNLCATIVTSQATAYTIKNQKIFNSYMDAAECNAKAYIKKALDCSYTVQTRTTTSIAETNLLINNCLDGKDKCKPCDDSHTCQEIVNISEVAAKHITIPNPFLSLTNQQNCVILSVKK